MKEIWYDVKGFEGYYQYSNTLKFRGLGRSFLDKRGGFKTIQSRLLKIMFPKNNYASVSISKESEVTCIQLHKFFAIAFIPNPENKKYVNHKNGNKHDYSLQNLEWSTKGEDILHAYRTGLRKSKTGSDHHYYGKVGKLSHNYRGKSGKAELVLDLETGIFYDCIKDAAIAKEITYNNLVRYVNGLRKNKTNLILA